MGKINSMEAKYMCDKNYEYFISHFDELYLKFPEKYIVIKNQSILGAYDSFNDAYTITISTEELGTFLIQECTKNTEKSINNFFSNNVVFA